MAILTGPLFSLDARGQFAKTLTFAKSRAKNYVKNYKAPHNPKTPLQSYTRLGIKFLSQQWASFTENQKLAWQQLAETLNLTPYHAYLKFNAQRWAAFDVPSITPLLDLTTTETQCYREATKTDNHYEFTTSVTWVEQTPWCCQYFASTTDPCPQAPSQLIHVACNWLPEGPDQIQITTWHPPDDATYYFQVRPASTTGGAFNWAIPS
jgi:hypothetical protein